MGTLTPEKFAKQLGHVDVEAGIKLGLSGEFLRHVRVVTTDTALEQSLRATQSLMTLSNGSFIARMAAEIEEAKIQAEQEQLRASAQSVESEKTQYARGLELGNTLALSVIIAALTQAGHADAARLLSSDQPSQFIVDQEHLSASEKRGLLQAMSLKVTEITPILIDAEEYAALKWLTSFASKQITQSLQLQGVTRALLGERDETTASATRPRRTPAMFSETAVPPTAQPGKNPVNTGMHATM